jgi:hypothetical protein
MLAELALSLAFAAGDLEGYFDRSDRIACAAVEPIGVRCGAKGRSKGLLLRPSGAARRVAWEWRPDRPVLPYTTVAYGKTFRVGPMRCVFRRSPLRVRCHNADGHAITVTRTQLRRSVSIRTAP